MSRRDGEPDGSSASPPRGRASGRLVVMLVVVAAAIVVLSTAVGGPAKFTSPFGSTEQGLSPIQAPPQPPAATPPSGAAAGPVIDGGIIQTILEVLGCAIGLVVAIVLIRLIVGALRRRRARRRRFDGIDVAAEAQEVADAPTVLRGIAGALAALDDEDREPGDAIVLAWLGLQQAAEDAGFVRSPAETPTEFTGRVLSRSGTDRSALRTLLRLYLGARFGDRVIAPSDAATAREALRALEASWGRVPA